MSTLPPIAFAGARIDRADHIRSDPVALEALRDGGRLLHMEGLDPVLTEDGRLAWSDVARLAADAELVFLGIDPDHGGIGCFAQVPAHFPREAMIAGPRSWQAMAVLPADELASYGAARALVGWHARHRFCAQSGHPTTLTKGGWQRNCTDPDCRAEHFPRTDPVTIMLVEHQGQVLLGRQPRFPAGRYSALAGFVEPGETIEEAVAREVFEEAGVRVRDVTYVASQPWPFPSSLMIGCHAQADDPAITVDTTELEDARWFSREDVGDALQAIASGDAGRSFGAPPATAIAHVLLRWWYDRGD
ncbi:NAD(+) diphosphatase [Novosphingobium sp. 9U]|uniref:NAD(+) diphosphatase n=1 Tax=Novosphingobium sp. 9U TaxID=2653158 RepID=UPI0012F42458|nr:NAD(+) diphosphatase [Novosphingobium sp. 9U]VWX52897.1 NADH pyrophosphatase [Novosphingobium sp. 9U]